jgi:hypothetical protein
MSSDQKMAVTRIGINADPTIVYASCQNYVPLLGNLTVTNSAGEGGQGGESLRPIRNIGASNPEGLAGILSDQTVNCAPVKTILCRMSNQPETFRIEVDDRESAGAVLPTLREITEFHVEVMRLPLGDYRVDGRFLFERKTLTDLAAAIKDGRLFRQALRLAATPLQPAIILEGSSRELAGSGMRWEAIQGALVTVTLFCGRWIGNAKLICLVNQV